MNVKFAAQTVAVLSEFIMYPTHPSFQNAEATALFMRTIDRLFNILNVKNLYDKGFKQSLKLCYQIIWSELIVNVIEYFLTLKTIDDTPLILHHREIFAVGFITAALSKNTLAFDWANGK